MIDSAANFILDQYPYIIFAIIVGLVVAFAMRYHYTQVLPAKKDSKDSCDKLSNLPCGAHENNIKNVDNTLARLGDSMDSIKELITEVTKWIMKMDENTIDVFIKKNSPYQLTAIGSKMLELSKGKNTIDLHLDFFIEQIESFSPVTAFDVEDRSMDVILSNIGHEMFNDIKNFVYYSPSSKEIEIDGDMVNVKISMPPILRSMSIYLRDKYFEKYPEIEDVDWKEAMNRD